MRSNGRLLISIRIKFNAALNSLFFDEMDTKLAGWFELNFCKKKKRIQFLLEI